MDIATNVNDFLTNKFPCSGVPCIVDWCTRFCKLLKDMLNQTPANRPKASEVWEGLKEMVDFLGAKPHCENVSPAKSIPDVDDERMMQRLWSEKILHLCLLEYKASFSRIVQYCDNRNLMVTKWLSLIYIKTHLGDAGRNRDGIHQMVPINPPTFKPRSPMIFSTDHSDITHSLLLVGISRGGLGVYWQWNPLMSRAKPVSREDKKTRMMQLLHETCDFWQLKELEKMAPKTKGIVSQSVKDIVEELVVIPL